MDTIQAFLTQEKLAVPQEFVVGGASKVSQTINAYNQKVVIQRIFLAWMDE